MPGKPGSASAELGLFRASFWGTEFGWDKLDLPPNKPDAFLPRPPINAHEAGDISTPGTFFSYSLPQKIHLESRHRLFDH